MRKDLAVRLAALDPDASAAVQVIAYSDGWSGAVPASGTAVFRLERDGAPHGVDAMLLERAAAAVLHRTRGRAAGWRDPGS